jgi:hypothetical protein
VIRSCRPSCKRSRWKGDLALRPGDAAGARLSRIPVHVSRAEGTDVLPHFWRAEGKVTRVSFNRMMAT